MFSCFQYFCLKLLTICYVDVICMNLFYLGLSGREGPDGPNFTLKNKII